MFDAIKYFFNSGFGDFKFPDEAGGPGGAPGGGQPGAMEEDDLYN